MPPPPVLYHTNTEFEQGFLNALFKPYKLSNEKKSTEVDLS